MVISATAVVDSPPAFKRSPSTRADPQNQAQPQTASAAGQGEHIHGDSSGKALVLGFLTLSKGSETCSRNL